MKQKIDNELLDNKKAMNDLATYQDNSIISRTLLLKESGNVTLFAFDKGQELSEHTAPFAAMVYILDGRSTIFIDGKKHELAEGETIIMPAEIPHALKAEEKFKMLLIMIK